MFREKPKDIIGQVKVFLQLDNFEYKNGIFKSKLLNYIELSNVYIALDIKLKQIKSEKAISAESFLFGSRTISNADFAHAHRVISESEEIIQGNSFPENPENAMANLVSQKQFINRQAKGYVLIDMSKINSENLSKLVFVSKQEKEHSRLYNP